MITWKDLFTTYAAITTLFITSFFGTLGYLISKWFDLKTKKLEGRYSLFYQKKLDATIHFIAAYAEVEKVLGKTAHDFSFGKKKDVASLDLETEPIMNFFSDALKKVQLFLNEDELHAMKDLNRNVIAFKFSLNAIYIQDDVKTIQSGNVIIKQSDDWMSENEKLLEKISKSTRDSFLS